MSSLKRPQDSVKRSRRRSAVPCHCGMFPVRTPVVPVPETYRVRETAQVCRPRASLMAGTKEIGGGDIGCREAYRLGDLTQRKTRSLSNEERKEVEKALKNIRVFVCHRETVQRYRVYGLTEEATENLYFADRDGKNLKLLQYFKDHYNYYIQFRNLPCLQISRSKPCYLPMELCMICEGQKFLGMLSDDQTARILRMGSQTQKEGKATIDRIVRGPAGPTG
ncbi:hypothetical protein F3Y22_tig00111799pilonHSYRG00001 [Hibiscus syriacus]|uniref:PAZ domain-containing protein n=1 Tax=Hibiscus syriacus TaxID=106335 RepID=A0A6A2XC83_HIBSY|nr:hypothetical protein F3Y22_tig00111799pilonHSYRG00001 [Hibiscus syriacus]